MSYQWPLDPQHLFGERYAQMVSIGLPVDDVDGVRDAITDMWADSAGGWVYEWSKLAESYADAGSHQQAALAYGWAKFPTLADEHKRVAQAHQLEQYVLASPGFGVDFQREVLELPYQGGTTPVPVHLLAPSDLPADAPVVLACGGTDLWKMDMHIGWVVLAMQLRGAGAGLRHPRHRGIVGADDESRRRGDRARPHRPRPNPPQRRSGLRGRLHGRALRGSLRTGRRGRRRRRLRWAGRSFLRRGAQCVRHAGNHRQHPGIRRTAQRRRAVGAVGGILAAPVARGRTLARGSRSSIPRGGIRSGRPAHLLLARSCVG
jgi:hypothetical protein